MNTEQIKQYLKNMQQLLEEMKQEKQDASIKHPEGSDFMNDLDEDILLCSLTINDLTRQLKTKTR
tara:strand:+ start:140 stop:334 length:195 start_codon:yes stop_codon:yes gene_type:complete